MIDGDGGCRYDEKIPSASRKSFSSFARLKDGEMTSGRQKPRWTRPILIIPLLMLAFLFYRVERMASALRDVKESADGHNARFADASNRLAAMAERLEAMEKDVARISETGLANDMSISRLNLLVDSVFSQLNSPVPATKTAEAESSGANAASGGEPEAAPRKTVKAAAIAGSGMGNILDYKEFVGGYVSNRARYDADYKGKSVIMSVTVAKIADTPLFLAGEGKYYVESESARSPEGRIRCFFPDAGGGELAAVKPGTTVLVRGKVVGEQDGVIYLNECALVR